MLHTLQVKDLYKFLDFEWSEDCIKIQNKGIIKTASNIQLRVPIKKHDLIKDQILLNQALKFIKENPKKYLTFCRTLKIEFIIILYC